MFRPTDRRSAACLHIHLRCTVLAMLHAALAATVSISSICMCMNLACLLRDSFIHHCVRMSVCIASRMVSWKFLHTFLPLTYAANPFLYKRADEQGGWASRVKASMLLRGSPFRHSRWPICRELSQIHTFCVDELWRAGPQ